MTGKSHVWTIAEEEKLMQICERDSMKDLFDTNRWQFYTRIANEMNSGSHPKDYIRLTPDKIKDKLRRFQQLFKNHCKISKEVAEVIILFPIYAPLLQGN